MNIKKILILATVLLAVVFSFNACKQADSTTGTLTVILSEGVTGIPTTGTYYLETKNDLQYSFRLNEGYSRLTVLLDETAIAASGTLNISGEHTLQAYADDHFQCALTVTLTDGVSGTPGAGTFNYAQGSLVNYSYALQEGYYGLTVQLDGVAVDSSGTVAMSAGHKLSVSATAGKNIRGTWRFAETYNDDSTFYVTATFSGNHSEGTVTDSDGGSGTYTFNSSTIAFNLVFPHVTYEYSGSFTDDDTMKGTCKRYQTAANVISGTWIATRTSSAASLALHAGPADSGRKGDGRQSE